MRETIELNLKDLNNLCFEDSLEGFQYEESTLLDVDLEDRYAEKELVFKRISDNRFFKIKYQENSYSDLEYNTFPIIAEEVFPETIAKVIYK